MDRALQSRKLTSAPVVLLWPGQEAYGSDGGAIIAAYRQDYPHATPFGLYAAIVTSRWRIPAFAQASRKATLGAAPVYAYIYSWRTPVLDNRPGSFHASEISFVFDNAEICDHYRIACGLPYVLIALSSTRVTRRLGKLVSTSRARLCFVKLSRTQHTKPSATRRHIAGEIDGPLLVESSQHGPRTQLALKPLAPVPFHHQAQFAIYALHLLMVNRDLFPSQQNMQAPVTESRMLPRQRLQLFVQLAVIASTSVSTA